MSEIPDSDKTQLLFKEFTGVTNVKQASPFPTENFAFTDYIFGSRVFSDSIPALLPSQYTSTQLDICNNIIDGTFIDFDGTGSLPNFNLRFYKKIRLDPAESGSLKSWYLSDGSGGSLLANAIPFKYDPVNSSYVQKCYREITSGPPPVYFQIQMYSSPLFWLFDYKSGFLQFYGDETTLGNFFTATNGPRFSFFQYIGPTGVDGGGGGSDISGVDISNIQINLEKLNRMILPDGYVDISGTDYDLCGNEVVRTYYTYNRAQMFVGYDNLPILDGSAVDHSQDPSHNNIKYELDVSGSIYVSDNTLLNDVSCSNLDVSGILNMKCNNIIDVSNIFFCNNTALLGQSPEILTISGDLDMSMNQIITIADATDPSGVPSWGQVQELVSGGAGSYWIQNGTDLYYNTGNVGIGTSTPATKLEVIGDISCGDLILSTAPQDLGSDNLINLGINASGLGTSGVLRVNTNSGDLDIGPRNATTCHMETNVSNFQFNKDITVTTGNITSGFSGGQFQDLTLLTDTFNTAHITCKSGGGIASVAKVGIGNTNPAFTLDVLGETNITDNTYIAESANLQTITLDNNLYTRNTNLIDTLKITHKTFFTDIWEGMLQKNIALGNLGDPGAVPTFASALGPTLIPIAYIDIQQAYDPTQPLDNRPYIANAMAYFTVKFSQPSIKIQTPSSSIDWAQTQTNPGTFKSFLGGISEQTIHFVAGYIDNYQDINEVRKPKPFIKILSTNIINQKCLTGITVLGGAPANIQQLTNNFITYYQSSPTTPKIGGISRIIIAEGLPGDPAPKEIRNKAWIFLEQTWNDEPWQGGINKQTLSDIVSDHIIDVKMYSNNTGELSRLRNPGSFPTNTDWQLVTEQQIQSGNVFGWDKFILPMGTLTNPPNIFNIPTNPTTIQKYTLQVGGTPVPDPPGYPIIYPNANLWEVWLNLKDWPYGITTTEEVFENNVDIYGLLTAQDIIANDIICQNIDVFNSIDVGPNQKLTFTENSIVSTVTATNWAPTIPGTIGPWNPGLEFEAENFYFDCTSQNTTRGFIISLARPNSDSIFRIVDNNNNYQTNLGLPPLFQVEGSGLATTQSLHPWVDMCYNIGISSGTFNRRYKTLYVGNIDASENVDISGDLTVDGNTILNGNLKVIDLSATNIDISNNLNVLGHTLVTDLSATNIDVSNNLNVEGLITGVAKTTFVEYRDYTDDIPQNISDWYCIARTKDTNSGGGADNARGLFILDDNTSGRRQQIIFYAGTSYSRGNYINVIANNWYGPTPTITNLKLETGGIYEGTNLYIYRVATTTADRIYVRLYENTRPLSTGGQWELTATPISGLSNTPVNLDITYNPNNQRANSCSSLDHSFQGDVSMNTLNLSNLDVQNTIKTKILEVEDSTGNDVLKVDGPNKTSTFNFDSGSSNPGYIQLKDTNTSNTAFLRQSGSTTILEGTDLQVGFGGGVWGDITGGEVTGWFNTRDFFAVAQATTSASTSAPQVLGYSQITNTCPGGVKIIPTTAPQIYIEPPATGVYTITITGIWSGDAWGSGDFHAPILFLTGPAFHSSTPGGANAVLYMDSNPRYYNSGYTNYHTFNWTGRMLNTYNSSQAQYRIFAKNNGGGGTGTLDYTGQIQVTRIC